MSTFYINNDSGLDMYIECDEGMDYEYTLETDIANYILHVKTI